MGGEEHVIGVKRGGILIEIARAERELPHYNHVEIVAHQVIARDLKKVLLRRYFKSKDSNSGNSPLIWTD